MRITSLVLFILLVVYAGIVVGQSEQITLPNLPGKFYVDNVEVKGTITLKPGQKLGYSANNDTDEALSHLGRLSFLESLDFMNCDRITDAGLVHIGKLFSLKNLALSRCGRITDAGLVHLERLSSLESLNLSCTQITDVGLSNHITKLTSLKNLNLCGCPRITNKGVSFLKNLSSLILLILSDDSSIDLEIIKELQKVLHGLIVIDIINGELFYIYKGKVKKQRGEIIPQEDEK